ncbi:uncharacterized protein LOC131648360 isoform X2 [Vicia villosa]|uniref:uncharacterized protein LOC131648360 isoform X2 n=1 Tax=Vicia villosa TaxID=3911 RepID=UPI00273CE7E2|nr:uncharacterized protein LOC131648360 isoform X2 [Vicia villosa]
MDTNNVTQNEGDWKANLRPGVREGVLRIMLKQHIPIVSVQEESDEFRKIVQKIEEDIFSVATSKAQYLRAIVCKTRQITRCQDMLEHIIHEMQNGLDISNF